MEVEYDSDVQAAGLVPRSRRYTHSQSNHNEYGSAASDEMGSSTPIRGTVRNDRRNNASGTQVLGSKSASAQARGSMGTGTQVRGSGIASTYGARGWTTGRREATTTNEPLSNVQLENAPDDDSPDASSSQGSQLDPQVADSLNMMSSNIAMAEARQSQGWRFTDEMSWEWQFPESAQRITRQWRSRGNGRSQQSQLGTFNTIGTSECMNAHGQAPSLSTVQETSYSIRDGLSMGGDQGQESRLPPDLVYDVSSLGIGRSKHGSSSQVDLPFSINSINSPGEKGGGKPTEGKEDATSQNTNQPLPNSNSFDPPASSEPALADDDLDEEVIQGGSHGSGASTNLEREEEQGGEYADAADAGGEAPVDAA